MIPLRQAVGIAALALLAGIAGVIAGSFTSGHGPPPVLTDALSAHASTRWIADAWIAATLPGAPNGVVAARRGDARPALVLIDLEGKPVAQDDWRGKRVVLNFWASWCAPCREEMPALNRFAQAQRDSGVLVVGLAQDDADAVRDFLKTTPVQYPIVFAAEQPFEAGIRHGNTYGVLPFTVLIDRDGRIAEQRIGGIDESRLEAWLADHP